MSRIDNYPAILMAKTNDYLMDVRYAMGVVQQANYCNIAKNQGV
jgi:hypothetical protein